ncbi:MAG TPA: heat-inducible transcriptional repressor HrcA [Bryobacteraceae bacterium]|nr:heat-inducible transcriptional repressor HrcA [Bryobacteraceae bacterium]
MDSSAPLNARLQDILHAIVRTYIETGEPVGSSTIAKRRQDSLSAASIRNVMADLTDGGYLSQPHTSAGRVPTEKAFRDYVQSLNAGRMPSADAARLRSELSEAPTAAARVERSCHILTELTRNVGITAALPPAVRELDQIELVPLGDRRILVILVTRDHTVHDRVVILEEDIPSAELVSIRNYINHNFSGWRLEDARRELLERIAEERAIYDAVLRRVTLLYQKGLLEVEVAPDVFMGGVANLIGLDLHLTREKLRDLLQALEEKQRLVDLLNRVLEPPSGSLEVRVGLEEAHPAMKEMAIIGISFQMPSGIWAKIAVLGPMRMHYAKVMGAVLHTRRALESMHF